MSYTLTPEQFLAQVGTDEDDDETLPADPLTSIATSLEVIASRIVEHAAAEQAETDAQERYDSLDQAYADLEDKHQALYTLLADVEKIVAPSTSKLANSVREAITRWRNPEPVEPPEQGESPEPERVGHNPFAKSEQDEPDADGDAKIVESAVRCGACERYFADQDLLDRHACTAAVPSGSTEPVWEHPADDAPVEEWRAYARSARGQTNGESSIDTMNRSQIRTLLGITQPVEA